MSWIFINTDNRRIVRFPNEMQCLKMLLSIYYNKLSLYTLCSKAYYDIFIAESTNKSKLPCVLKFTNYLPNPWIESSVRYQICS